MPKGQPLGESQRKAIYHAYTEGEKQADIAATYGITISTVSRVINRQREKESMAAREKVVAGDKANGRLTSTTDPHRFEGTCIVAGKKHSKTFVSVNARKATEMWEKWCQELRDEEAFMDMVERKEPEPQPLEEITPAIEVKPWKDVAEERQARIEELEARVAQLEDKERVIGVIDGVISDTEGETPKLGHWFNDNGSFRVFWMNKPVYVLWAKADKPKLYGVYRTMELALGELDKLNEVAAFLGNGDVFEVEEVVWRG